MMQWVKKYIADQAGALVTSYVVEVSVLTERAVG